MSVPEVIIASHDPDFYMKCIMKTFDKEKSNSVIIKAMTPCYDKKLQYILENLNEQGIKDFSQPQFVVEKVTVIKKTKEWFEMQEELRKKQQELAAIRETMIQAIQLLKMKIKEEEQKFTKITDKPINVKKVTVYKKFV